MKSEVEDQKGSISNYMKLVGIISLVYHLMYLNINISLNIVMDIHQIIGTEE